VVIIAYFPIMVGDVDGAGSPVFGGVSIALLALIVVFPVVGLVQAAVLKRTRPAVYDDITEAISDSSAATVPDALAD
jgi:hypothetical protein